MNSLIGELGFPRIRNIGVAYVVLSRVVFAMIMVLKRGLDVGDLLFTIGWGLPPYVGLLLLSRRIGVAAVLAGALILTALSEALCWWDALYPSSSTAALGVFLQPLYTSAVVIPTALVLGWIVRRAKPRASISGAGGKLR